MGATASPDYSTIAIELKQEVHECGAYTHCILVHLPSQTVSDYQDRRTLLTKGVQRLRLTLAPDGQGGVDERDLGRIVVLESVDPVGIKEIMAACCNAKRIFSKCTSCLG